MPPDIFCEGSKYPLKLIKCLDYKGQSEVLLSHVYEFWPPTISLGSSATLTMHCVPTSKSDNDQNQVILKMEDGSEVAEVKDKFTNGTNVSK